MVRQRQTEFVIHAGPRNDLHHRTGGSDAVRWAELRLLCSRAGLSTPRTDATCLSKVARSNVTGCKLVVTGQLNRHQPGHTANGHQTCCGMSQMLCGRCAGNTCNLRSKSGVHGGAQHSFENCSTQASFLAKVRQTQGCGRCLQLSQAQAGQPAWHNPGQSTPCQAPPSLLDDTSWREGSAC